MKMERVNESATGSTQRRPSLFSIPAPLRDLFDLFPQTTYAPNDLPLRPYLALRADADKLFVWTTENGAKLNAASFNPACLKWQVYLTFKAIKFLTISSNNHASPTGQLPFLVPSRKLQKSPFSNNIVTTAELQKSLKGDAASGSPNHRDDVYMALIDGPIRRAWLFHMYLTPNFERFTVPCYIGAQSSSSVVRAMSAWDLRKAAESELLKHTFKISQQCLYSEAREAFQALNQYCAENISSNPKRQPAILDAALFAYTDLLWSIEYDCWADSELIDLLMGNEAILDTYDTLDEKYQWWRVSMPEHYIALERSLFDTQEQAASKTKRRPVHAHRRRRLPVEGPS